MERVLDKKAAARAKAALAPVKKPKKKLASTIVASRSKTTISMTSVSTPPALSKKRKSAASKQDDGYEDVDQTPEHDLDFLSLLSPSLATKKAKNASSSSSSTSSAQSSSLSTSTTSAGTSKAPVSKKPRTGPEVVVFDASSLNRKSTTASTEFNFKKFMSSKISKLDEAPAPFENPLTAEEKAEEIENKRNDTELHSLIKASRLLEQYNADQLDGADRRKHQREQLERLGIQKKEKIKVPLQISFGMMAKQRERDLKELEEAKNNGTYHKSIKHTFAAAGGKKKEKPRSERGLKTSMGRFKNGMLTLTEREIKSVQREGVKKKPSGKKAGGGRSGGGGGKKKKGKGHH
ncbi:hypothetical protein BC939DRAFT_456224 [Gamsiella multidivaricata]|uniref:uncharacterized protein n=1 Tax=Gamsiella multidivaricata TaxID=101098 RepID=UPI0022205BDE|nr:uncharacterized protein BC939DRAFT_456224 [Gamsiella multidivaricata]KAG0364564.1 hypothetical protein BGZ54_007365 [Gamsiella multidivaricata]KAI7821233.1 hypothetical protein BC939DRAFT_456224 [Gamsiella multidivaricata]